MYNILFIEKKNSLFSLFKRKPNLFRAVQEIVNVCLIDRVICYYIILCNQTN